MAGVGSDLVQQQWPAPDRGELGWLAGLLAIGLVARIAVAVLFPSIYHPDETFQYWEQGYRFAFGGGIVPWEYRVGIRSYVVPGFLAGVMAVVHGTGGGTDAWRVAIQILLSACSLSIVGTAYFWARRVSGREAGLLAALMASTWFELVYFSSKPMPGVLAAATLLPAAYLLCAALPFQPWKQVVGGALLGLTFVLRFQLAPAILLVCLATILRSPRHSWVLQFSAMALVILGGGLLDWVTLGSSFQSVWLNFVINAVQGRAALYGTSPVFGFLQFYLAAWPVFIIAMPFLLEAGMRRAPLLLTVPLVIVVAHSLIEHKEYRFVYPALPFLLTLASIGAYEIYGMLANRLFPRLRQIGLVVLGFCWLGTSIGLATQTEFRDRLFSTSAPIAAFKLAGEVEGICGLGMAGMAWFEGTGNSGLGQGVPIYLLDQQADALTLEPAYNVLVQSGRDWPIIASRYTEIGCYGAVCVAVRAGTCQPNPDQDANAMLERAGQ